MVCLLVSEAEKLILNQSLTIYNPHNQGRILNSNSFRDNNIGCSPSWSKLWGDCQSCNYKKNLTKVVEGISDQVGLAIKDIQRSLLSLACMVMDHHLALDFLLAKQRGVCAVANTSCCTYIYKHFNHCRGTCRSHSPTG
jgi:hypothetical protein